MLRAEWACYRSAVALATCITVPALAACASAVSGKDIVVVESAPLSSAGLVAIGSSSIRSLQFHDAANKYVLALFKRKTSGPPGDDGAREDRIELRAILLRRKTVGAGLQQIWEMKDAVDCDGLDIEADFFPDAIAITDLDHNGRAELTLAYKMFCGGGVDPKEIRVVMRNCDQKYVIEGESLVFVGDDPPFGGGRQSNAALLAAPREFKDFMDKTWRALSLEHFL